MLVGLGYLARFLFRFVIACYCLVCLFYCFVLLVLLWIWFDLFVILPLVSAFDGLLMVLLFSFVCV